MAWHRAYDIYLSCTHSEEGFYETSTTRLGKKIAVLVKRAPVTSKKKLYTVYRSNIGLQQKQEQLQDIERKYTKVYHHSNCSVKYQLAGLEIRDGVGKFG